jgi:hypothetical protein
MSRPEDAVWQGACCDLRSLGDHVDIGRAEVTRIVSGRGVMLLLAVCLMGLATTAEATFINYLAPTGQTATADYTFLPDAGTYHLQIILSETTLAAASSLSGAPAILSSVGFLLPDTAVIIGGRVTIATGSTSVGFSISNGGSGFDVSGEWGATYNGELPIDGSGVYDFVSSNAAQVTRFSSLNRDGNLSLDGPQGGLLDDSAARGGLGVVDNSVVIQLRLDALPGGSVDALTATQKTTFLASLTGNSIVEFGSDAAFGTAIVPQPATLLLVGLGLGALVLRARKRTGGSRNSPPPAAAT